MSGLSPELREFVVASRNAVLPTEADVARIIEGLRARLGDAALAGIETAQITAQSASTQFLLGKASIMSLAGLALLGGIWFFAAHDPRADSRKTPAAASAATTALPIALAPSTTTSSALASPEPDASVATAPVSLAADGDKTRPAATYHVHDRLAEEVAIISRAAAALRCGKPVAALEILNEHERKFGTGLLAEERIAARAQALRALGRIAEADAQLTRLPPKSVHRQHSRPACGSRKNN